MKTLTPAKTVAVAALAVTLALPAAQAKPTAPIKRAPAPTRTTLWAREALLKDFNAYKKAYPTVPAADTLHWRAFRVPHAALKTVMALLPWKHGGENPEGIKSVIFPGGDSIVVEATPAGLAEVQMIVAQRQDMIKAPPPGVIEASNADTKATPPAPRQVQLKFEWVASAGAGGAAPDKSVDALTIIAEDGRKAQVSSRHLQNGTGGEETITVLPRLEPGGLVALDITERSDSTARAGDTKFSSAETTVRVKSGDTGTVRVQVSKGGGQGAERVLFVTPTIVGAGGG